MKTLTPLFAPMILGAALMSAQAALAAPTPAATATPMATPTAAAATAAAKPRTRKAKAVQTGRMVTTKTSTGKTITYNCSKPGNASKKACK